LSATTKVTPLAFRSPSAVAVFSSQSLRSTNCISRERVAARASVRRAAVQHPGRLHRLHARLLQEFRAADRVVFLCLHPNEPYHLDTLRESCERFIFVDRQVLVADERVRAYLGRLADGALLSS
jgi:hypothetical protein